MSKTISRRSFLKRMVSTITTSFFVTTLGYLYIRYIEPKYIEISKHTVNHPLIPQNFDNVKIVQFSDTHIGHFFDLEDTQKVVDIINNLEPDIVCFTGDLLDEPNKYDKIESVAPILKKINAPLGKFFIYGNHDHGGYGSNIYKNIMEEADYQLLVNSSMPIQLKGEEIIVSGLDDVMLGRPDYTSTFKDIPANKYLILLVHEPDVAPTAAELGAHLQLSGHSHGGQIQLPFIGPLVTPPLGSTYYEGHYSIGDTNMSLFVNRGLGTTRLPFRFLSRPEISLYTLKKTND